MTGVRILRAGPLCTVQDAGRHGYLRYGVTPAGPMDWTTQATADRLLDNPPGSAGVEIGPAGIAVTATGWPLRVALSAPGFAVRWDGRPLPGRVAVTLAPGQVLDVAPGPFGVWGWLALPGGIDVAPVMGSRATHLRSGLGPCGMLRAGDCLRATTPGDTGADAVGIYGPPALQTSPIRYVPGPQDDLFSPDMLHVLNHGTFVVSPRSDRMAYRLSGPTIRATGGHDIVSDGVAMGAIQVPGDGQPFVLMADRQPTGGYPKIGTVIRADLPRLAQTRPGQHLRFQPVSVAGAVAALRAARDAVAATDHDRRIIRFIRTSG